MDSFFPWKKLNKVSGTFLVCSVLTGKDCIVGWSFVFCTSTIHMMLLPIAPIVLQISEICWLITSNTNKPFSDPWLEMFAFSLLNFSFSTFWCGRTKVVITTSWCLNPLSLCFVIGSQIGVHNKVAQTVLWLLNFTHWYWYSCIVQVKIKQTTLDLIWMLMPFVNS